MGFVGSDSDGKEWPKPDYAITWPAGLDESNPDLAFPRLPLGLNVVVADLDRMRADLATVGGELAVSSFAWMVKDGMALDPVRHRYVIEQLNGSMWPYRYRDIERLAAFQRRVFEKYAANHGLTFVDVAGKMPFDPDLWVDAVHTNYAGSRMRGWVNLQALIPLIEKRLKDGTWPKTNVADTPLPTFTPRQITFNCSR
jgi:hypothetical protein